jgi:hypothetical protein
MLRAPAPTPAAGVPAPLGITLTQAASPAAMAVAPRPPPPRLPTPPPMPPVVVPPFLQPELPAGDFTNTAIADAQLAFGQPLLRGSMSNEYAPPPGHAPLYPMGQHSPADVQRLFAPPSREEQRTITAQSLKRRVPVWAVAVGSAVVGLLAFALVVLALSSQSKGRDARAKGSPSASAQSSTPPVVAASSAGPFTSARSEFETAVAAASSPTNDAIAPAGSASPPPAPPPPSTAPTTAVIPTTNIASLPPAAAPKAPPAAAPRTAAPPATTTPSTAAGGAGTLKVICFPGCDQVIDNGSALGPSPIIRRNASVGSHRIKLVWSDSSKVVSTVVVTDQTATVRENHP